MVVLLLRKKYITSIHIDERSIIMNVPIVWKADKYLEREQITPYKFMKETGLSQKVAYGIAKGEQRTIDVGIIDKVMPYLRTLPGNETLQLGDVVEYV